MPHSFPLSLFPFWHFSILFQKKYSIVSSSAGPLLTGRRARAWRMPYPARIEVLIFFASEK